MKYSFFLAFGLITFAQSSLQAFPASNLKALSAQIFLSTTQSDDSNPDEEQQEESEDLEIDSDVTPEEEAESPEEAKTVEESPEVQDQDQDQDIVDPTGDVDPMLQDSTGGETIEVYESITGEDNLRCVRRCSTEQGSAEQNCILHCLDSNQTNLICTDTPSGDEADIVCLTVEEHEKFCPCARKKK